MKTKYINYEKKNFIEIKQRWFSTRRANTTIERITSQNGIFKEEEWLDAYLN